MASRDAQGCQGCPSSEARIEPPRLSSFLLDFPLAREKSLGTAGHNSKSLSPQARRLGVPQLLDGSWKIPSFEMDENWGYPYDSGNHHLSLSQQDVVFGILLCLVFQILKVWKKAYELVLRKAWPRAKVSNNLEFKTWWLIMGYLLFYNDLYW